jgi:hypothetical protein
VGRPYVARNQSLTGDENAASTGSINPEDTIPVGRTLMLPRSSVEKGW